MEYGLDTGKVIARMIHDLRDNIVRREESHTIQYVLKRGLKEFGRSAGKQASKAELLQMHQRVCFNPTLVKDLTKSEKRKAMLGLMILSQKKSGVVRGRLAYNGRPTRNWISREDASRPTASTEGIFLRQPLMPTKSVTS